MSMCVRCGAEVPQGKRWCPQCGEDQFAAQQPVQPDPMMNPVTPPPPAYGARGRGYVRPTTTGANGWTTPMKILLWIVFALFCIAGLMTFIRAADADEAGIGFVMFLISVIVGYFMVAGGMIMLNAAEDLRVCAKNTEKLVDLIQDKD